MFKDKFRNANTISVKEIFEFYKNRERTVKKTTVNWRIHKLVETGVIQRVGRGKYRLGNQKDFIPPISEEIKSLYLKLKEEYPFLDIAIWSTEWVVPWMLHIPGKYEVFIEVEKEAEESVFYFLSDFRANVFLNPSRDLLAKYAKDDNDLVVVKNLVTGAPLQKIDGIQIPGIEKILVDLIADKELFASYQGRDLESIIESAFEFLSINRDKLFRYAARRGKKEIVEQMIEKIL